MKHNREYAQPLIDGKMREVQNPPSQEDTKAIMSIADELRKLAKLKEQGVITEEEFSQMKSNSDEEDVVRTPIKIRIAISPFNQSLHCASL